MNDIRENLDNLTTIEISAVVTYDKDTDKFDILLFDNAEAARQCYLAKGKIGERVCLKYKLPIHQKFLSCEVTEMKLGDEVAVTTDYQKATIFGVVVDIDEAEGTFDILVRRDCKDRDRPSVRTFVLNSNNLLVLKTGKNLHSIASYVQ